MSKLKAFLQPPVAGRTKEVVISDRFKDEEGNPVPFVIQAIDQKKNEQLANTSTITEETDIGPVERLDHVLYTRRMILACVKEPDFADQEVCKYYGTVDPLEVPAKMLSIGEYNRLSEEIMNLNDIKSARKKVKEAKNS